MSMRWWWSCALLAACSPQPAAKPVEAPPPSAEPEPAAEVEPQPCAGEQASCAFEIQTPKGWKHQHQPGMWIAEASSDGAVVAMRSFATPPTDAEARRRDIATALAIAVAITPPDNYLKLTSTSQRNEGGAIELSLWETSGAVRGKTTGAILVFSGQLSEHVTLVGIGYAPRADDEGTGTILAALRSVKTK